MKRRAFQRCFITGSAPEYCSHRRIDIGEAIELEQRREKGEGERTVSGKRNALPATFHSPLDWSLPVHPVHSASNLFRPGWRHHRCQPAWKTSRRDPNPHRHASPFATAGTSLLRISLLSRRRPTAVFFAQDAYNACESKSFQRRVRRPFAGAALGRELWRSRFMERLEAMSPGPVICCRLPASGF